MRLLGRNALARGGQARLNRRTLLKALGAPGAMAAALGLGQSLGGCQRQEGEPEPDSELTLRIPLSELPVGQRVVRWQAQLPVELRRSESGVTARSLLCTHFGCTVEWKPSTQTYDCPCHEGRFDSEGRVLYGPPKAPLEELDPRIEDGQVIVDL